LLFRSRKGATNKKGKAKEEADEMEKQVEALLRQKRIAEKNAIKE
jgi:hypothetical protein